MKRWNLLPIFLLLIAAPGGELHAEDPPSGGSLVTEPAPQVPPAPMPQSQPLPEVKSVPVQSLPRFSRRARSVGRSRLTNDESEANADRRRLLLTSGEDKAVDLNFDVSPEVSGITIGNPTLLATTLVKIGQKRQIVFKPLKPGDTNITVRDADGTIRLIFNARITGSNLLRVAGEVRSLLRDVEGLDIRIVGPKVILEGEILVPNDYARLLTVVGDKAYGDFIMNLTTLSPLALQFLAKKIQEDINVFAPGVKTRVVNGLIFLEGTVDTIDQANRAKNIALLYLPEIKPANPLGRFEAEGQATRLPGRNLVQTFIIVNAPPPKKQDKLVRITAYFVELSKDYNRLFGFKWQPGFTSSGPEVTFSNGQTAGATTTTTGSGGVSFSATISSLLPKLQSAQAAGYARILKTGTLVVRSGQAASLFEGTQFPFLIQGANGQVSAGKQDVGLELGVTPTILGQSEDIQVDIKVNQTNLVGRTPASGTQPITATHRVDTKLYVKSAESAAIAGVSATTVGTDFNKDDPSPGSFSEGTDPLFTLLRSKNYRKSKSQFVIFITPQIIENASDGTEDLKRNFRVKMK